MKRIILAIFLCVILIVLCTTCTSAEIAEMSDINDETAIEEISEFITEGDNEEATEAENEIFFEETTKNETLQTDPESAVESTVEDTVEETRIVTQQAETQPKKKVAVYEIQPGDTLYSIASRNQVILDDIIQYNMLEDIDNIKPGQIIYLPGIGDDDVIYDSYVNDTCNTDKTVKDFSVELVTTNSDDDSWYNIELASSQLNGLKLSAGESFSWAQVMGPNDSSQGYRDAGIYTKDSEGNTVSGTAPGGGVCFVSTALMQAARGAGCIITEKHDHSLPVSYADRGDEASVSWGSWDLQFYNPSESTDLIFYFYPDRSNYSCTVTVLIED